MIYSYYNPYREIWNKIITNDEWGFFLYFIKRGQEGRQKKIWLLHDIRLFRWNILKTYKDYMELPFNIREDKIYYYTGFSPNICDGMHKEIYDKYRFDYRVL